MLRISTWDEIGQEWSSNELPIPATTRDPEVINKALGVKVADDENGDGFVVREFSVLGPVLTIVCRGVDRNHLAIIVVNYEDQDE